MANKPIISINIDDANFAKFKTMFDDYTAKVKEAPDMWNKVNVASGKANLGLKTMLGSMTGISKAFESISKSVISIGKWGVTAGALGAATGLFGVDKLAGSVFNSQRQARGSGVSIGQLKSFGVNLGRYVDPSALSTVANARNDLTQQWAFRAMGIGANQENSEGNFQLTLDMIKRAKAIWDAGPKTQQYAQARGLTQFFTMDDLRRLGATPDSELNTATLKSQQDTTAFGLSDKVAGQWAKLSVQLDRAGVSIETSLIKGLTDLTGPLGSLSSATTSAISSILGSQGFKWAIDETAVGIGDFAKWISSPFFKTDLTAFSNGIKILGQDLLVALKYFGLIPGTASTQQAPGISQGVAGAVANSPGGKIVPPGWGPAIGYLLTGPNGMKKNYPVPSKSDFSAVDDMFGLPNGTTLALAHAENGSVLRNNLTSPAGAQGLMQLMPDTQKQYGVSNPFDPIQSAVAAGAMMRDLRHKYKNDPWKAVAAYNWGESNLDRDIAANGKNWFRYAPHETRVEVRRFLHNLPSVRVIVTAPPAHNVAVTTNNVGRQ